MQIIEQIFIRSKSIRLLSMIPLFVFANQALSSNYSFRYTIYNVTLGPVNGVKNFEVLVKDNKPVQVANTSTGIMLSSKNEADGLADILNVISNKKNNYHVIYNKNGFPKEINIQSNINIGMVGSTNMLIYLYDYQNVSKNFSIKSNVQKRYFTANYEKWSKLNLLDYTFRYQDSKIDHKYINGVRIKVSNNKIVGLIDEFTLSSFVPTKTDRFLTIEEIFKSLKGGIDSKKCQISVDYDIKYGYPSYIHYQYRKDDTQEILLFNLKKEKK